MSEQIKPMTLAEEAHVALLVKLRDDARRSADAAFADGMAVFRWQYNIPADVHLHVQARVGPVPACLLYDLPGSTVPTVPPAFE